MIPFEEAYQIIRTSVVPLEKETVLLADSQNRILAEEIVSDVNIPPFNKAAMDGFACRRSDLPGPLRIVDEIPAGKFPTVEIKESECARIMTGAPIPVGADVVFMVEYHEIQPDGSVIFTRDKTASNICLLGEDVKEGDVVLPKGTLIQPQEIAILAGAGKTHVDVFRRPIVGVISTGSELVEPNILPAAGQIRNSNGHQMVAQLKRMGMVGEYFGIVPDSQEELRKAIHSAMKMIDVLFISGGVSVGDYDFVPLVLQELEFEILITSIATKPGKHTLFARKEGKYVLGFPGNPVSSFVQLETVGRELLCSLMGNQPKLLKFKCVLLDDYHRKASDRLEFLPVQITETGKVKLLPYNGSAHIHVLSNANAIMEIPIGVKQIEQGDLVSVRPL
jgi:molybdopterin molybdotransferase